MSRQHDKIQKQDKTSFANTPSAQQQQEVSSMWVDRRPVAVMQRKWQEMADRSAEQKLTNRVQTRDAAAVTKLKSADSENATKSELPPIIQLKPGKKTHILVGAAVGTIVPILGNIVGGLIGYAVYKHKKKQGGQHAGNTIPPLSGDLAEINPTFERPHEYTSSQHPSSPRPKGKQPAKELIESISSEDLNFDQLLAALRKGSAQGLQEDKEKRIPFSDEEQENMGLALLPMLLEKYKMDQSTPSIQQFKGGKRDARAYKLVGGKLRNVHSNDPLTTNIDFESNPDKAMKALLNSGMKDDEIGELMGSDDYEQKIQEIGGLFIFAMNSAGDIFAGEEELNVVHHSSFLAGGAVAAAGYIRVENGVIKFVNNLSGHYHPGPAYLWQALIAMAHRGVDLKNVKIKILGVDTPFANAEEFVRAFNPIEDPSLFNTPKALKFLNELS